MAEALAAYSFEIQINGVMCGKAEFVLRDGE